MSIPATQRAWQAIKRGVPAQAVVLKTDLPVPTKLNKGDVLVKVQAAALNPVGYTLMGMLPNFIAGRPLVPEHDLAGVIVDPNGTKFSTGDNVFGWIPPALQMKTKQGTLSEYTIVSADNLALRPPNISPVQAAGVPLVALTAYQAIFGKGKLEAGQTLFVNGGSTSVGDFAIQFAKAKGCKVVATASGKNEEFVKASGADEFIDYTAGPLHERLIQNPPTPKYHVFLDAAGLVNPALYSHSEAYLAPGGVFISTGPAPKKSGDFSLLLGLIRHLVWPGWLGGVKRTWVLVQVQPNQEHLEYVRELLANGTLKPHVDSVYSFDDVQKAYEKLMSGRARGKIIIKVDQSVD